MHFPPLPPLPPLPASIRHLINSIPPIVLYPLIVVVLILIIITAIKVFASNAKSTAGALLILMVIVGFLALGFFILSQLDNILLSLEKIFTPILHF
jgi:hypothetical protein